MDVQTLPSLAAQNVPADSPAGSLTAVPVFSGQPIGSGQVVPGSASSAPLTPERSLQLPQEVAKIFSGGSSSNVTVSFHVAHNPNEIVTVFKDTVTGQIITQVPSEMMVKIAEFFDQVAGVVLDKSA